MNQSMKIVLLLVWTYYLNDIYLIIIDSDQLALLWSLDFIFYFLVPTSTLVWLFKTKRISLQELGLDKRPQLFSVMCGLILCIVLYVTLEIFFSPSFENLTLSLGHLSTGYSFPGTQPMRWILVVYASITSGVLEEIIFRGIITTRLQKYFHSKLWVVMLSCLVFAGIHWSEGGAQLIKTFVWALLPTIWFLKRKDLWGLILCHSLYNFRVFGFDP